MSEQRDWIDSWWLKVSAGIVVLIVGTVGAVVLERMGSLQTDMGTLSQAVQRVDELDELKEKVTLLEFGREHTPHAQLSSALDQFPGITGWPIEMELVDSISDIGFDPKRSSSEIKIEQAGDHFLIAAAQIQRVSGMTDGACFDMWLRVSGDDLRNSSVRHCWGHGTDSKATTVLVLQAMFQFTKNDVLEVVARSIPAKKSGLVAISPGDIPLVPSIIFSVVKVH